MGADILVASEHREGAVVPTTAELVAVARGLAAKSGGAVVVAVAGKSVGKLAGHLASLAQTITVEDPRLEHYSPDGYEQALRAVVDAVDPRVILLAHTATGFDLAPRIAAAWDLPIVTNVVALDVEGRTLVATRKLLNDKVVVQLEVESDRSFVATVRPATYKAAAPLPTPTAVRSIPVTIDTARLGTTFVAYEKPQVQDIDISQADIVVSAGRGIQKKENLPLIEQFAKMLGGVVGASRPLTDLDWLPKTRQVGQSGKTVRPKLYIACGVSGAMQHIAGMKDAGLIIAVNTDPTAPIFEVAHYGFTANVLELLPAVMKELQGA